MYTGGTGSYKKTNYGVKGAEMRDLSVSKVTEAVKEMCIEANHFLSADMQEAMRNAVDAEESPLGKQILTQLKENSKIAGEDMIPICQDTGMAVVFVEVGHRRSGKKEACVGAGGIAFVLFFVRLFV